MFSQQKSTIPSKITKQIMQVPQKRIEKSTTKTERNKSYQNKIVTAIVGDSMIKDLYVSELSDKEGKVVVKHFSRRVTFSLHSNVTLMEKSFM